MTVTNNQAQGSDGANGSPNTTFTAPSGIGGNGGNATGGGLDVAGGSIALTNDTLSGNYAQSGNGGQGGSGEDAGGNGGNAGNATGGGLYILSPANPTTTLANTLIAENNVTAGAGEATGTGGSATDPDVSGTVTSSDHDLIGDPGDSSGFGAANGDILNVNPDLGPPQNNGGPTQTLALLPGSPAIDAGDSNAPGLPSTDQRGYARIVGNAVDIGAYEFGASLQQLTPSVSVVDAGGTYNGNPYPATATVAGVDGQAASSLEGVTPTLIYYAGNSAGGTPLTTAPSNAGTYTVVASFAGSSDYSKASAQTTFTINAATASIQLSSITVGPNLLTLNQTETFQVHLSSPDGVVNAGTVTFSVDGHNLNAAVDGDGDATARLSLPLLTAAFPQSIGAAFSGPNRSSATTTQSVFWNGLDMLAPAVATFAATGGQSVQSFLLGLPLLDFLYTPQGQLTKVIFGPNLLSWDFISVNGLTVVMLDGVLPVAAIARTP